MFTIALKTQRVIVFLSIGTRFSSRRPENAGEPLKEESGLIPEKLRERCQGKGWWRGARGLILSTHLRLALSNEV